jgi:hypothetical protein
MANLRTFITVYEIKGLIPFYEMMRERFFENLESQIEQVVQAGVVGLCRLSMTYWVIESSIIHTMIELFQKDYWFVQVVQNERGIVELRCHR